MIIYLFCDRYHHISFKSIIAASIVKRMMWQLGSRRHNNVGKSLESRWHTLVASPLILE
jgi:hypothetical protein